MNIIRVENWLNKYNYCDIVNNTQIKKEKNSRFSLKSGKLRKKEKWLTRKFRSVKKGQRILPLFSEEQQRKNENGTQISIGR